MKSLLLSAFFLTIGFCALAQSDYRVVFDLTSKDSLDQRSVIRWINEITNSAPDAKIEVVMYGQGISMAVNGRSYAGQDLTRLAANKNISFRVCAIALKNQGIDKSQLFPGVETVPDGIYEVISKQRQGWGYIKVKI